MQDGLNDLDSPVADEEVLGGNSHSAAELVGDHAVLRGIELQQPAQLARANHLAMQVIKEQVGGVRIGKKAGIHAKSKLGNHPGQRGSTRRMRSRLPLQQLDPLSQRRFAGTQSPLPRWVPNPSFKPPRRHAQVELPHLELLFRKTLTDHFDLCLLIH